MRLLVKSGRVGRGYVHIIWVGLDGSSPKKTDQRENSVQCTCNLTYWIKLDIPGSKPTFSTSSFHQSMPASTGTASLDSTYWTGLILLNGFYVLVSISSATSIISCCSKTQNGLTFWHRIIQVTWLTLSWKPAVKGVAQWWLPPPRK